MNKTKILIAMFLYIITFGETRRNYNWNYDYYQRYWNHYYPSVHNYDYYYPPSDTYNRYSPSASTYNRYFPPSRFDNNYYYDRYRPNNYNNYNQNHYGSYRPHFTPHTTNQIYQNKYPYDSNCKGGSCYGNNGYGQASVETVYLDSYNPFKNYYVRGWNRRPVSIKEETSA